MHLCPIGAATPCFLLGYGSSPGGPAHWVYATLSAPEARSLPSRAYHLARPFAEWYDRQTQRLSAPNCYDLSLATDGIDSFEPAAPTPNLPDIPALLLLDRKVAERPEMLAIKVRCLENALELTATDDVAIVRVILG
ncbi:hypothetical protein [Hymenobacter psychrophilus]|uniref:Uncharacterized protein n=1 Tax=Hymenobacter psychrophilus TaxID=651662 RepID=A0A1H3BQ09_9BACT|nr:hypothetical protein [Hymenobacter psychrophilus]SDX43811.1 hypothetical protein SAMN04488069_101372 [Hymenobacter psychrophilus]